ncbi:hypothetical protein ACLOJK_008687 [Asimina triloba]
MQILLRTLRSCHFYNHLVLQNPRPFLSSSQSPLSLLRGLDSGGFSCLSGSTSHYFSSSAASSQDDLDISDERIEAEPTHGQEKTDESAALESSAASPDASRTTKQQHRSAKKRKPVGKSELQELKEKLRILEREMRALKPNAAEKDRGAEEFQPKLEGLYSLFKEPPRPEKKTPPRRKKKWWSERTESRPSGKALRELSPEFLSFLDRLHEEGYLKEANFMKGRELNLDGCSNYYFHGFVKSAAERFGHSHQEIAKYLSGSHLKEVALFGCPTIEKKTVFAAKELRSFFSIEEDIVCRACKLKSSCSFVNQRVQKKGNVQLMGTLRVLTSYTLEAESRPLVISDDMKLSINKLLKEQSTAAKIPENILSKSYRNHVSWLSLLLQQFVWMLDVSEAFEETS